jgi:hypothetical protein
MGVPAFQPPFRRRPRRAGHGACLLAALGLLAAPVAALAAPRCPNEAEQSVFEVEALKSELMVVGITCKQEDRYNAFMERYRPRLAENYRAFEQHFNRTRGRAGKSATDAYVTNLAQTRGFEAQKLGSDFCLRNPGLFDEVMALPSPADLPAYAAGKDLIPESLGACATTAAPTRTAGAASKRRGR